MRPEKFRQKFIKEAFELCSIFGADDAKLAEFFKVGVRTVQYWKEKYPLFLRSAISGKEVFDNRNVETSLLSRALGCKYEEVTYERVDLGTAGDPTTGEKKGEGQPGEEYGTKIKTVVKWLPPDVTAIIFWLKNRQRGKWQDRPERPLRFKLPKIVSSKDLPKLTSALLKEVGKGQMTPGEASNIASLVSAHGRSIELTEMEARLAALEAGLHRKE